MPIEHEVDIRQHLLRVRRWGNISTHDEAGACRDRAKDPLIVPGIPVLVDCTHIEPADSTEVIRYLADCISQIAAELRCGPLAIVVSTDVEYGMSRMYMAYTEMAHQETNVFRSEKEALDWLGKKCARIFDTAANRGLIPEPAQGV